MLSLLLPAADQEVRLAQRTLRTRDSADHQGKLKKYNDNGINHFIFFLPSK